MTLTAELVVLMVRMLVLSAYFEALLVMMMMMMMIMTVMLIRLRMHWCGSGTHLRGWGGGRGRVRRGRTLAIRDVPERPELPGVPNLRRSGGRRRDRRQEHPRVLAVRESDRALVLLRAAAPTTRTGCAAPSGRVRPL